MGERFKFNKENYYKTQKQAIFFKFVNINWLRKEIEYYTMTIWHAAVLQSGR